MKARTLLNGAVTIDPEILGGAPVFTGTRVPIENLFDFLSGGQQNLDSFLVAFPRVKREHAQCVLAESSSTLLVTLGIKAA
jgi:uncharacterized protein (DUF433 family)